MAYYPGDIPSEDLVIEPARNGLAIDLTPFNDVEVDLYDPTGTIVSSSGFTGIIDVDQVVIEWPSEAVLTEPGVYELRITLVHTPATVRERLAPLYIVVQDESDGWHTHDSARAQWSDAPADDRTLYELLHVARHAVVEYAPALAEGEAIPLNYVNAQLMQARNVWNSSRVDSSGELGDDTFTSKPFPLDWEVKQILRPKRGIPWVA